jgi:DNA processing protein
MDTSLSPTDLRDETLCERFQDVDTRELEQWMAERQIGAQVLSKEGHFAFGRMVRPPAILYTQWDVGVLDEPMISIVWPRKMSDYQERVVRDFFLVLQQYHVVTVSGGAPGVDSLVHELSLESGIPTVVVLGAGFRSYLRSARRHLLQGVVSAWGLVVSEFRLREKAAPWTFPQRNRIIAGLGDMVFLPGAAKESGSLITVDFADKMHVPVYGVPGSVYDEQQVGSNGYMAQGKILPLLHFDQCLDQYFSKKQWGQSQGLSDLQGEQKMVYEQLLSGDQSVHALVYLCQQDISVVLGILMELQLAWRVAEVESGVWW